MTDNIAVLDGYTVEILAENDEMILSLLVRPGTDFETCFRAWDIDEQEFIRVNGWLFTTEMVRP